MMKKNNLIWLSYELFSEKLQGMKNGNQKKQKAKTNNNKKNMARSSPLSH